MRHWLLSLLLCFLPVSNCLAVVPSTLKIALITDVHYLSPQLIKEGDALKAFEAASGRRTRELHEVLDEVLAALGREKPDILLVTGDLSNHGELVSHSGFVEKLRPLQNAGTRIYVIPGNHDILVPDPKAYKGSVSTPVKGVTPDEFARLYGDFGYDEALLRDDASLSYMVEINEKIWLLAIDSNRYNEQHSTSISGGRIRPETLEWALEILRKAREKEVMVLGMMHHGLVEHMPYQEAFFSDYLIEDWRQQANKLADAGLGVIFTGHFHANDITLHTSPAGNPIYDIETASLAQYPFAYRVMQLQGNELHVNTRFVTSIPGNPDVENESRRRLETITRRVAQNRLDIPWVPIPEEVKNNLIEMIVQLHLMHVRGDETTNPDLRESIRLFATMMGAEVDMESFAFDFPPEDKEVLLTIGVK